MGGVSGHLDEVRALNEEAQAVLAYFRSPYSEAMKGTEEAARWIMRYDAVSARMAAELKNWPRAAA